MGRLLSCRRQELYLRFAFLRNPLLDKVVWVTKQLTLEVPQDKLAVFSANDRIGYERYLTSAARRVNDEVRHRVACRMSSQPLDYLQPFLHRRPEV